MVWCASQAAHAGLPMPAWMRLPSSPGQGMKSRPSASRCSYWQKIVRVMASLSKGVEQLADGGGQAESGDLGARQPALRVIVAHVLARSDPAQAQRLQVQAVVAEGVDDGRHRLGCVEIS